MRTGLLTLVALVFAASATVASGLDLHFARQENRLLDACGTAETHILSALSDASSTQVQTIETRFHALTPGRLVGHIAFGRPGSDITAPPDAAVIGHAKFTCGHSESTGRVGAGPGPAPSEIVSRLQETLAAPGRYTLTFTLNQAGRGALARLGAAERGYRKRHPRGDEPRSFAWSVWLHYSPVR